MTLNPQELKSHSLICDCAFLRNASIHKRTRFFVVYQLQKRLKFMKFVAEYTKVDTPPNTYAKMKDHFQLPSP